MSERRRQGRLAVSAFENPSLVEHASREHSNAPRIFALVVSAQSRTRHPSGLSSKPVGLPRIGWNLGSLLPQKIVGA
jgi:hypothetical protein